MFQILSVGVDVLSEKHHFHNTVSHKLFDLFDNVLRLSAPLASAHIRHDAVTAEVIAAEHDIDAGLERIFSLDREFLHDLIGSFPDIHHHLLFHEALVEQLRKFENVVGSEDQVNMAVTLFDLCDNLRLLHHAAAECDHHIRIFSLHAAQISKTAIHL